jgi:hypothetical protein
MQIITERCAHCGEPFTDPEQPKHYGDVEVCRQSHSSPAEYQQTGPFCSCCWFFTLPELDAHNEERESLKGYSYEELERI